MVEPDAVVIGVGAVADPMPPVAVLYQSKLVPEAVKAVAVAFWQYVTGVVTVGAGVTFIVTVIDALGPSQVAMVWLT